MITRPLIMAITRAHPEHLVCFRVSPLLYLVTSRGCTLSCGVPERDKLVTEAAARGMPVLIVEPINENTPA